EVASLLRDGEALQVRVKSVRGDRRRDLIERAGEAVALAAVPVFLNGTVEDAIEFGYRAVHLPEANIARIEPPLEAAAASIHSFEALRTAEEAGVDFAVAGAVFAPGSHPGE